MAYFVVLATNAGGTVAMLVENAGSARKGFYGSFQQMSQGGGVLIAGLVGLALTHFADALR